MKTVFKCAKCGKLLTKTKARMHHSPDDIGDRHIMVQLEPCPVCLEHKYKMGKAIARRRPRKDERHGD